jgi:hypothetical protein
MAQASTGLSGVVSSRLAHDRPSVMAGHSIALVSTTPTIALSSGLIDLATWTFRRSPSSSRRALPGS